MTSFIDILTSILDIIYIKWYIKSIINIFEGNKMDKNEILEKSRKENNVRDEREKQISSYA